jgi:N,N'-diacetyllegionaminate synthase
MDRVLIIAEAGVNHNGDIATARQLVDVAARAGADCVKFQTFKAERLVTPGAEQADYQVREGGTARSQLGMLRDLELSPGMHRELVEHCRERGVQFNSTGFDERSVDFLVGLGIDFLKVPSGEITNLPHLRHIGQLGKPVVLSTGMATLEEVGAALDVLDRAGTPRSRVTVLHCNTEYPTPMSDVNLRAMCAIRDAFGVAVGYSDHTMGIEIPIAAVAMGATVIEKHFTLSRDLPGPDHRASLEQDELQAMVAAIRNIEQALGDGVKRPSPSELKNIPAVRKSLVAAAAIPQGERFSPGNVTAKRPGTSPGNVTAKRPGTGVSPMRWDEVMGRRASRAFAPDELIEL